MNQEEKTDADIKKWVTETAVTKGFIKKALEFEFFSKSDVNGANINPVYRFLKSQPGCGGAVAWNFSGKFLISSNGKKITRSNENASKLHGKVEELLAEASTA
uniref:Uncharacterized protein n=1 Tax=Hemiselmis andersenii TaxID=464988 RepID=A0A6T8JCC0_HEMAN|mmetsp:Transcript_8166/g.19028  ORF Transcript_8166/g.19028 Transcript_8166/m.19028 type:complete len:103 (-) Transcript_8166:242-550(-)